MTAHTPRPWRVVTHSTNSDIWCVFAGNHLVCEVYGEDNARLVAAAPDLLATSQAANDLLSDITTEEFSRGEDASVRDALATAIAKAQP